MRILRPPPPRVSSFLQQSSIHKFFFTPHWFKFLCAFVNAILGLRTCIYPLQFKLKAIGTPAIPCKDNLPHCDVYGDDICTTYPSWAEVNCRAYCRFCKPLGDEILGYLVNCKVSKWKSSLKIKKKFTFDYKVVFLFIVEFVTLGSVGPGSIPVNKRTKERKNRYNRFSIFVDIQIWKLSDSSLKIGNCLIRYNLFLICLSFFHTICLSIFWFF